MRATFVVLAALLCADGAAASDVISLDVLPCGKPGEAGGLAAGPDLRKITVDTRRYPNAVCNDGSPAVYYIRPYQGEENRGKWVIMLQ